MKHYLTTLLILAILLGSCNRVKEKTKKAINKSGETVGKSATEFVEGVDEGIDKTLECQVIISDDLKQTGLSSGKYTIEDDTVDGRKNVLSIYLIFNEDFQKSITAKVFDKNGLEYGRCNLKIEGLKDESGFFDFYFEKRTQIEAKSKIYLE